MTKSFYVIILLCILNIVLTHYRLLALENFLQVRNNQRNMLISKTLYELSLQQVKEVSRQTCKSILEGLYSNYPDNNSVVYSQ